MAKKPLPKTSGRSAPERESRIDLNAALRRRMADLLNLRLADAIDLGLQAKQAHWNVRGPNFAALHKLFDEVAERVEEVVDELAERCVQLGGVADGRIDTIAHRSELAPYPLSITSGADHVQHMATALATFAKSCRAAIEAAADAGDQATADLFTEAVRGADKLLWMVEAHAAE